MKNPKQIYSAVLILLLCIVSNKLYADEFILDPSTLTPDPDIGYYVIGIWVDTDGDDIPDEFHNGCDDYYENPFAPQENHQEIGTQQGFTYVRCMIMPDCEPKGSPIDPPVANGYIQIAPCQYSGTDSASLCYIQSPSVSNLESIYLETSADVSINDNRKIPYFIEYSKDDGETWEPTYLRDNVLTQGGYRVTYDGSVYLQIQEMIDASLVSPIVIRIITNDVSVERPDRGQYVKVHSMILTAEEPPSATPIHPEQIKQYFNVWENTIIAVEGTISVYSLLGQHIATGKEISLKSGIYIVRTMDGMTSKIFIK